MADKKRWTLIDTLLVIVVIIAGVGCFKMFNTKTLGGDKTTIKAVVMLSSENPSLAEAMTVGDKVTVSLTEKDSGVLTDFQVEDSVKMVYNAIDGEYVNSPIEGRVDIYATIEMDVTETDYAFILGSTPVKVGEKLPFRGKGYATEGFVVELTEED